MAEEKSKKPKIDLKARLGKTSVGPSVPTGPSSSGGADGRISVSPASPSGGIAPPPGIGGGFSPFAPKPQPKAAPVSAEAQTIKVEVSEEIHDERKRATRRAVLYSLVAMVAGAGIGFVGGGMREKSEAQKKGLDGMIKLEAEVTEATKKSEELIPLLDEIEKGLRDRKYPDAVIEKLNSFAVPFNSANLDGKNVGNMPGELQRTTFSFLRKCEDLDDKKNALKGILGNLKKPMEAAWAKEDKPVFELGVTFRTGAGNNIMAEMVRIKEPWAAADTSWPKEPKIIVSAVRDRKRVEEEKTAAKYEKELTGQTPVLIPVSPESVSGFTDERVVFQLLKAVGDVRRLLQGDDTPGREVVGLLKEGENLAKAISNAVGKARR